jgi:hypothetical protein
MEIGVRVEFSSEPAQSGLVDELIGQHDVSDAERTEHADLTDRRCGRGAGPRVELAEEQLRRHVRLAVRRQLHPIVSTPSRHRDQVVGERLRAEHTDRSDGAGGEQIGPLSAHLGRCAARPRRG